MYAEPSQPQKLAKPFCVNCLNDVSRSGGPSRKSLAIYQRAHQQRGDAIRVEEIEADMSYALEMERAMSEHTTPKTVRIPAASLARGTLGTFTSEIPLDAGLRELLDYISEAWVETQENRQSIHRRGPGGPPLGFTDLLRSNEKDVAVAERKMNLFSFWLIHLAPKRELGGVLEQIAIEGSFLALS